MELEEKIHQIVKYHTGLYKSNLTKEISELADNYAIEFAEWCLNYTPENIVTSKQLLEIFKKEKGL